MNHLDDFLDTTSKTRTREEIIKVENSLWRHYQESKNRQAINSKEMFVKFIPNKGPMLKT